MILFSAIEACFQNKKYPLTIQTSKEQIVNSICLNESRFQDIKPHTHIFITFNILLHIKPDPRVMQNYLFTLFQGKIVNLNCKSLQY